jgi:O-acetyl-ADP-ribose deacetylase (regulator of RNase III)
MSVSLGVCGAIHRAAGPELEEFTSKLPPLKVGDAVLTRGFRLKQSWVIHVCGPSYHFDPEPERYLSLVVENSLRLANEANLKRIAFPAISMGIFAFPHEEGASIMVKAVVKLKAGIPNLQEVRFVVLTQELKDMFDGAINSARVSIEDQTGQARIGS